MKKNRARHYEVFIKQNVLDEATIYLCNQEGIDTITEYIDLLEYFRQNKEGDFVELVLSGPGGDLNTTIALMAAVAKSKAIVQATVLGNVASGHAMLTLACDTFMISPGSSLMLHTFTGGGYGKGKDGIASLEDTNKQVREILEKYASGFLSDEDIDKLLENNRDVFYSGDELLQRINNMLIYRKDNDLLKDGVIVDVVDKVS